MMTEKVQILWLADIPLFHFKYDLYDEATSNGLLGPFGQNMLVVMITTIKLYSGFKQVIPLKKNMYTLSWYECLY